MATVPQQLARLFDLSEYESKIYVCLFQNGPQHLKGLAKHTSIPRTALYTPVEKLVAKGMVSATIFGRRRFYEAAPVDTLRAALDVKRDALEIALQQLTDQKTLTYGAAHFESALFYGSEGIKSAGLIFLNETTDKVWYSFENLALVGDRVGFEFERSYIQERVRRGVRSKMILSHDEGSKDVNKILANDVKELRETILLSAHEYPLETTTVCTKGLTLMVNPTDNPFALLIRNKAVTSSLIQLHRCIWDKYVR